MATSRALAGAILLVACGGTAPVPATAVAPPRPTRHVIEDTADEDTEDGVELVSTRGHMNPAAVQAGIAPHAAELSACYTEQVGKRRWLGGKVTIHWDISRAGVLTAVKLAESDLGAWPIEQCLLTIASAVVFSKPVGGDADFSLPLEFSARGTPAVWPEDRALRAIGGQVAELEACKDPDSVGEDGKVKLAVKKPKRGAGRGTSKSAKAAATAAGAAHVGPVQAPEQVLVTIYVGPGGKAESVGFASAESVLDPAWATCASSVAMAWRLPDPRGTVAKLTVTFRPAST